MRKPKERYYYLFYALVIRVQGLGCRGTQPSILLYAASTEPCNRT